MKAERRHELKENSLAKQLEQAPAFFQQHGSRLLLALVLCLLGYVLVRNHLLEKQRKAMQSSEDLGDALYALDALRTISPFESPKGIAANRSRLSEDVEAALKRVLASSEDPQVRARAMVARGDLDWQLANFPELPTTEPAAGGKNSDDLLQAAESAYSQVLQAPLNQNKSAVIAARFSLAAIDENRKQWDKASAEYQRIMDDGAANQGFRDMARKRLDFLKTLEKPLMLGSTAAPRFAPQAPATPSMLGPELPAFPRGLPTTQPTSAPALGAAPAATAPTTAPAHRVPAATQPFQL